jgi:hypothetical protein
MDFMTSTGMMDDFFRLWSTTEQDFLNPFIVYKVEVIGQGMRTPHIQGHAQVIVAAVQRNVQQLDRLFDDSEVE